MQYRDGRCQVKILDDDGKEKWMRRSRRNWELKHGDIPEGVRIFRLDGDPTNDDPGNLVGIKFNTTRFSFLKRARVVYDPAQPRRRRVTA